MSFGRQAILTAGASVMMTLALAGAALAQTMTPPPAAASPASPRPLGPVQTAPRGELAQPAPRAGARTAAPAAQSNAPVDPATSNTERVFVDTRVTDVRVGDELTVATMSQSPLSACASNEYVFERNRAKWLFQTGRLLQAMREGAVVRISFTCLQGYQSINAIQFLSPPTTALAQETPRPGDVVRVAPQPAAARPGLIPLPTPAGATANQPLEQRVREIPAP